MERIIKLWIRIQKNSGMSYEYVLLNFGLEEL